jgi:hypothetical protein
MFEYDRINDLYEVYIRIQDYNQMHPKIELNHQHDYVKEIKIK